MQKQTRQVTYGCLLHDIGKLLYRAGGDSGTHSRQGWAFLRSLWREEKEILRCVQLHHAAELRATMRPRLYNALLLEALNRVLHDPLANPGPRATARRDDLEQLGRLAKRIVGVVGGGDG